MRELFGAAKGGTRTGTVNEPLVRPWGNVAIDLVERVLSFHLQSELRHLAFGLLFASCVLAGEFGEILHFGGIDGSERATYIRRSLFHHLFGSCAQQRRHRQIRLNSTANGDDAPWMAHCDNGSAA